MMKKFALAAAFAVGFALPAMAAPTWLIIYGVRTLDHVLFNNLANCEKARSELDAKTKDYLGRFTAVCAEQ